MASLRRDLGQLERAVELLEEARALYRELNDPHLEGRTLLQQAVTLGFVEPETAIRLAQDGLALTNPTREPHLKLSGRHSLALLLNDTGKPREALSVLEFSRPLYAVFKDPRTRIRLHWLEGKIARNLGDLAEAEETFKRLWSDLQDLAYEDELAMLSVELIEVYVAQGKYGEALELAAVVVPLLRERGMYSAELAMWLLITGH